MKKQIYLNKQNLSEQNRIDESSKTENYSIEEINERKSCSKKLSKCVAALDYIDKILIVSSATTGGVSICSFTSIVGASVGITNASFTLICSLSTEITKKVLSITRKTKEKA